MDLAPSSSTVADLAPPSSTVVGQRPNSDVGTARVVVDGLDAELRMGSRLGSSVFFF